MTEVTTQPARRAGALGATILKNVTSSWMSMVANIVISFFLSPLIVHSLGSVYYGIWALLMQFSGYLWLFDFGVRESVIKYVAQYHASGDRQALKSTVHAALSLYTVIALLTFAGALGVAVLLPSLINLPPESASTARTTAVITGVSVAQGFIFNVFVGVLWGLQKFYLVARLGVVFSLVRAGFIVLVLAKGHGIVALALVHLMMNLTMSSVIFLVSRSLVPYLSFRLGRPRREDLTRIVNYGKYVLVNNIGQKLVFVSDSFVIGVFLPISALTYYAIAGGLVDYLRSAIGAMAAVVNPVSSDLEARQRTGTLGELFLSASKIAMVLGLPVSIGFIVLGERFIGLWMGPSYARTSGTILAVLASAHLIGLPHQTISAVLYGLGKHRIVAILRVCEAAFNVSLSIVLVQVYGLIGVALGTLIPHVVFSALVLPRVVPTVLPVRLAHYYLSTYVRPIVAALPFVGVCVLIERSFPPTSLPVFFALMCGALFAYAIPCWRLALNDAERRLLRSGMSKLLTLRLRG